MTATHDYISRLTQLKPGELGLLRTHAGQGIDESVAAFDLFTGIWWPLRDRNRDAPRRGVAWLVAKLYASCPMPQADGNTLPRQLRRCEPTIEPEHLRQKFDEMLLLPLAQIEPALRWAIGLVAASGLDLDWVRLTDDLSIWQRENTRLKWAEEFVATQ